MPIKNKDSIKSDINQNISNNSVNKVTPEDIRRNLIDIIDSHHILSSGNNIVAQNISSDHYENTRLGDFSLHTQYVGNHPTSGNTALGYGSIFSNYTGDRNTGVGSYTLYCNMYGSDNLAAGYAALSKNRDGDRNISIGSYSLKNLKTGNNNIAIGHAAGYYVGENDNYQFYLGSYDIDGAFVCDNPNGPSGVLPLLRGDLLNNRLGINLSELDGTAALQVNGDVTPYITDNSNLGSSDKTWDSIHVNNIKGGQLNVYSHILPDQNSVRDIGASGDRFRNIYGNNLNINGTAHITNLIYDTIEESQFVDKTIYLASSGTNTNNFPNPYLTDEGIDGAGFVVQSSGNAYQRNYYFVYRSPDTDLELLDQDSVYSRSSWETNISMHFNPGRHIKVDRIIGNSGLDLINESGYGFYIEGNNVLLSNESQKDLFNSGEYEGSVNYYSQEPNFSFNLLNTNSGIVRQDILTRFDETDDIHGFRWLYNDENLESDRISLSSHNGSLEYEGVFTFLKNGSGIGYSSLPNFIPEKTFDISAQNSVIRNSGVNHASLELLNGTNGIIIDSNRNISTVLPSSDINILSDLSIFKLKMLGDDDLYGTVVSKENPHSNEQNLYFINSSGEEFNLTSVDGDKYHYDFVYHDETNLVAGSGFNRVGVTSTKNNIFGNLAGYSITNGSNNILIGYGANSGVNSSGNIIIGNQAQNTINTNGAFYLGHQDNNQDPLMSGLMPEVSGEGHLYINHNLTVNSFYDDRTISILNGPNGGFLETNRGDLTISVSGLELLDINYSEGTLRGANYHIESGRPTTEFKSDINLMGALNFHDGTYLESSSGVKTQPGVGISYDYDVNTDVSTVNLDFSALPSGGFTNNNFIAVQTEDGLGKFAVSELSQFVNHTNPQMFFESCQDEYNLVLSNDTFIDHTKNCANIFIGKEAGDYAKGFTNSTVIGLGAGQDALVTNPDLEIDVASVFLGYNAGRKSKNADNSVFIGPSAGQNSIDADNSVFIGNSAGESSRSEKSIGIGDNALESVIGSNNLEIVADKRLDNPIIGGAKNNKFNIADSIAGDSSNGHTSVGDATASPSAVFQVRAKDGDCQSNLQEWFNCDGVRVAYLDQQGNIFISGTINNENIGNIISYSFTASKTQLFVGESITITATRTGSLTSSASLSVSSTGKTSHPSSLTFAVGVDSTSIVVTANIEGEETININSQNIFLDIVSNSNLPVFTNNPYITPSIGYVGNTYTGVFGTIQNGTGSITGVEWRMNGLLVASSGSTYAPTEDGTLSLIVTATNEHGSTIRTATAQVLPISTNNILPYTIISGL